MLVPVGAPFGCEVEEVPERLQEPHVARILPGPPGAYKISDAQKWRITASGP